MRRAKLTASLLVITLLAGLVAGCAGTPEPTVQGDETEAPTEESSEEGEAPLKVAMVLPGPISDQGYNQRAYEGLMMIQDELGCEVAFSESTPVADFDQVYRDFADRGFDVIIGHGYEFGEVALRVGPDYPDVKFIAGGNPDVGQDNVAGVTGAMWESAWLMGVLAGLMTETDHIGAIGGFDFPTIVAQMENYRLGAESVNPDIEVTIVYIGSFDDVANGKEAALAQASAGADVIFHIADHAGVGVIQAAEEEGVWAIGYSTDQNSVAPDTVISSLLYDSAIQYKLDVEKVLDGTWTGDVRLYGVGSGVTDMAPFHGLVPEDIAEQVSAVRDQIEAGDLEVPYITTPGGESTELQETEEDMAETFPAIPADELRVAAVFPGSINDEGFNQVAYQGLLAIRDEMGAEIAFSERTPIADFNQVYRDFAEQGYQVIIGHGFQFGEVALEVAPDYPDIRFIVDNNSEVSGDNIAGIAAKAWDAAYLMGALAGLMTESDQIGGIAGFDMPNIVAQMEAYKMGARDVNPDVETTVVYIGTFEDVANGKEAALAQASAGVDVIFHIADAAGVGVIQACEESGIWAMGWGADQNHLAPDTVLTSLLTNGDQLLMKDVQLVVDGEWTGGVRLYGLDTGVADIADFHGLVPEDIASQVDDLRQQIIDGELEVPYMPEATD